MFRFLIKLFFPHSTDQGHRTVRHTFSFVFAAILVAGLATTIAHDDSYISIETESASIAEGQKFYIDVKAFAHIPINAIDIKLSYPESSIAIDTINTGESVITLWTEEPYAKDGGIYLRGGTFRKGFVGTHTIARIEGHAIEAGEARIIVQDTQLIAGDGKGTVVDATESSKNIVKIAVTGSDGLIEAKARISVVTDIDEDGDVDLRDVSNFMGAWLTKRLTYDFNNDGRMTIKDFSIVLAESFFN